LIGSTISHYKILRKIGEGGMGVVYEAEDLKLGRRVALKFLSVDRVGKEESRQRFLREARSAAAISHPNICTVYEVDEADGQLFIAMEYCEGQTFRQLIRQGPLPLTAAIHIVLQVADALTHAHARQVVHRDVKSSNIIVDDKNRARLLDFGLASLGDSSDATLTMEFVGTPAYMAPERFEKRVNDARGDIWALGVILYEAISGRMPFGGDIPQMVHAILNEYPPPLSSSSAHVPPELDDLIERALAKDPSERYQHIHELLTDLSTIYREAQPQTQSAASGSIFGMSLTGVPETRPAPDPERVQAVAVLPFVNMSHNAEDDFLSDGLTEEVTNALTQVRGLRVVSRASTFQFKSPALDLRDVGRRLRVGALVLGNVRCQGNRVRVTAQLVKASNSHQLWSQRFDCEMKNVFDVEDELTGAIVENLKHWLGTDLEVVHLRGTTSDYNAHELYLRGRHAFNQQTARGAMEALLFFSRALEVSPGYALARVGIADCYALQGWYGIESPAKVLPRAKAELDAALAIEEALPSAWCLRGAISAGFDWDWERARTEFRKAFSLGPATSELLFHHALDFLTPLLRLDEALAELKLAIELDPVAPLVHTAVGGGLYRMRRYPEALQQFRSTLELDPDFYHAHWSMGRVYQAQGLFSQAMECFERALKGSGDNPSVLADVGHCRSAMGDASGALQILEQVAGNPLAQSIVSLGLGKTDAVLSHLAEAVKQRARGLTWLGVDPRFDKLREQPNFYAVMAPVGLNAPWKQL
jgi:serine/threonine-protein kinase